MIIIPRIRTLYWACKKATFKFKSGFITVFLFTITSTLFGQEWKMAEPGVLYAEGKQHGLTNFKVGIGTKTPTEMLELLGNFKLQGNQMLSNDLTVGGSVKATSAQFNKSLSVDGVLSVGESLTNITGNYKMVVNGKIGAREFKVTQASNWPDFVFEENYPLNSLMQTELYIKQHKHLPGIPSANEIENDGLELSQILKLQMQKIEELTLYLIEQNKKLEEQQKEIEALKLKVN